MVIGSADLILVLLPICFIYIEFIYMYIYSCVQLVLKVNNLVIHRMEIKNEYLFSDTYTTIILQF